jgi:hypothetical protein
VYCIESRDTHIDISDAIWAGKISILLVNGNCNGNVMGWCMAMGMNESNQSHLIEYDHMNVICTINARYYYYNIGINNSGVWDMV